MIESLKFLTTVTVAIFLRINCFPCFYSKIIKKNKGSNNISAKFGENSNKNTTDNNNMCKP